MNKYFLNFDMLVNKWIIFFILFFTGISFCIAGEPTTINEEVGLKITTLSLEKVSGDKQKGCVRKSLKEPLVVKVTDKNGGGVAGASISFSVEGKDISLSTPNPQTNINGEAKTQVIFGEKGGDFTITAKANDSEVESGSPQIFSVNAVGDEWGVETEVTYPIPKKIEDGIKSLASKLGGVEIEELPTFSTAVKKRDCCLDTGSGLEIIENGEIQGEGKLSFKLWGKDKGVPGWSTPTITKEFDFGVAIIEVDFALGVYWDFSINLAGSGGRRENVCDDKECFFGSIGLNAPLGIGPKFEAILCTESWWTSRECTGIKIQPIYASASLSGSMGWDMDYCGQGFNATAKVGEITIKAEFSVWDGIGVSWSKTFWGFTLF